MFIVEDKKGNKTARLSRHEQGVLAATNIMNIKVQQAVEQKLPSAEIVEMGIVLAEQRRNLEKMLWRKGQQ